MEVAACSSISNGKLLGKLSGKEKEAVEKKDVLTKPYSESLLKRLIDPEYAADYLNAVREEGDPAALFVALRYVVEARDISHTAAAELKHERGKE